jgi:hypothetical protein
MNKFKFSRSGIFVVVLACSLMFLGGCASTSQYAHSSVAADEILNAQLTYGNEYGYLYLTHDKVMGNPVLSHRVMDNCRYAGTFYSDTFILVKLVPGSHVIRVVRPAEAFFDKSMGSNKARLTVDVQGGELYVYDNHIGWKSGMVLEPTELSLLKGMAVSRDCVDCAAEPDPDKSLDMGCFER